MKSNGTIIQLKWLYQGITHLSQCPSFFFENKSQRLLFRNTISCLITIFVIFSRVRNFWVSWCFEKNKKKTYMRREVSIHSAIVIVTVKQYTSSFRLTAHWVPTAEKENVYLYMCNKIFSNWLPSYTKIVQPVLDIFQWFNISGY